MARSWPKWSLADWLHFDWRLVAPRQLSAAAGFIAKILIFVGLCPFGVFAQANANQDPADISALCSPDDQPCGYGVLAAGDHYYVYPNNRAGPIWRELCITRGQSDDIGLPVDAGKLTQLPRTRLQAWVAADGALNKDSIQTITFCGFRLDNILDLDWSATDVRVRFFLTQLTRSAASGEGRIFASRGQFANGLTIDRSLVDGSDVQDAHFGSFVEIERSVIGRSLKVRNTTINGALRLRNNRFENTLRLEAVEVGGDTILSHNKFRKEVSGPATEPDGTSGSIIRLRELRVGGVLQIAENLFSDSSSAGSSDEDRKPDNTITRSFYLQKSIVGDNDLTIAGNEFSSHVFLIDVEGKRLSLSNNKFAGLLHIAGSNFFSVRTFDNEFFSFMQLRSNQIDSSLIVDRDLFRNNASRIEIIGNKVAQEMRIAPRRLPRRPRNLAKDEKWGSELVFTYNNVAGPFDLYLPTQNLDEFSASDDFACDKLDEEDGLDPLQPPFWRWRGGVDFTGSSHAASLQIAESCYAGPTFPMIPINYIQHIEPKDILPWKGEAHCSRSEKELESDNTSFDFSLMKVGVLSFLIMPEGCFYQWSGINLEFMYFGTNYKGDLKRADNGPEQGQRGMSPELELALLEAWLPNLERENPEVYFTVAEYLRGLGEIDRSREWLARGRDVDFGPTGCEGVVDCGRGYITAGILFPSDFGTRPERVIVWLIALWLLMTAVYRLHSRGQLARLGGPFRADAGQKSAVASSQNSSPQEDQADRQTPPSDQNSGDGTTNADPEDYPTKVDGFFAHKSENAGRRFSLGVYSLDVTLPVIPLDHFREFTPTSKAIRGISIAHHVAGWWLVTLFFGSSFF